MHQLILLHSWEPTSLVLRKGIVNELSTCHTITLKSIICVQSKEKLRWLGMHILVGALLEGKFQAAF